MARPPFRERESKRRRVQGCQAAWALDGRQIDHYIQREEFSSTAGSAR
jgi:hypothetical protein